MLKDLGPDPHTCYPTLLSGFEIPSAEVAPSHQSIAAFQEFDGGPDVSQAPVVALNVVHSAGALHHKVVMPRNRRKFFNKSFNKILEGS